MASVSGWQLDRVSPAGGSVAGTIVITLYGAGLDLLSQVIYRPKYLNKPLRVLSPCRCFLVWALSSSAEVAGGTCQTQTVCGNTGPSRQPRSRSFPEECRPPVSER